MDDSKKRTADDVFASMFRELRAWNNEIPPAAERMDPILRILLQLYANQLVKIDHRVDRLWEVASASLIRAVCPEVSRWPIPAHTVFRAELVDPVVDVDTNTRMIYREKREGGQTFFFAPARNEKLIAGKPLGFFLQSENRLLSIPPSGAGKSSDEAVSAAGSHYAYLMFSWAGQPEDLAGATLLLRGKPEALLQLQWARWVPVDASQQFSTDADFCPGAMDTIERMFSPDGRQPRLSGSFRSSSTVFDDLRDNFVMFPDAFAEVLKPIDPAGSLLHSLNLGAVQPEAGKLFLIRLDLPARGDRRALLDGVSTDFGCFIATNRNDLSLFKHTAGNRVVDIILPEPLDAILEITRVVDSKGVEYHPRYASNNGDAEHRYTVEERNGRMVVWLDFTSTITTPPESITVHYAICNGTSANSIEPDAITDLYEKHPGIADLANVVSTRGAIPAKSEQQVLTEVSARVRGRDRALTFADVADWTRTFDPRILDAECENGVQRTSGGVRRCIVVGVHIAERDFYSQTEIDLLKDRLSAFLKARSAVNVHYQVETILR